MDPTSTGGRLIVTGRNFIDMGKAVGSEGDIATCPACDSTGRVFNDCFPNFDLDGKQALVSGARVYCKCPEKPILIETQNEAWVEFTSSQPVSIVDDGESGTEAWREDNAEEVIEQYLEAINIDSGERVAGLHYDLYVEGKKLISNRAMHDGCTQTVQGQCRVEAVIWHEGWSA
ncbi:PAAR domain-containing protein [Cupriavidus sp.]|uniref:PAAR domain-containing protein n=1 Tax=unclassified Cupriavidus TaxID=2640874 RepID=UPI00343AAEDB